MSKKENLPANDQEDPSKIKPSDEKKPEEAKENVSNVEAVLTYLTNGEHLIAQALTTVENETKLEKKVVLKVGALLTALLLLFGQPHQQQLISSILTVIYPVHCSFNELLTTANEEKLKIQLVYWLIFASFETTEVYSSFLLPGYWFAKTVFLLCVCLPPINLAEKWYIEWVKPVACLHQKKLIREVMKKAHPFLLRQMGLTLQQLEAMPEEILLDQQPPAAQNEQAPPQAAPVNQAPEGGA